MDFFQQQDRARGSTRLLIFLFVCAVLALIAMASLLVYVVLFQTGGEAGGPGRAGGYPGMALDVVLTVAAVVIAVVALGSLFRLLQLRGGGRAVAESMRGRLINLNTRDADERKVLNVVEEMAIASGLPVPPVYLIEDPAINAFAAGYRQEDAVIGVTRGCIEQLDREELQGVIAHEFSHIFNGDMRINIRLIGLLYGIMVLGLIGHFLLRGSLFAPRRNRNNQGLALAGLGLVVIGYGGTFFGNLIKAAVSRQREFLADASAVQFTRNPDGIAGALKKIGGYEAGSRIRSVDTSEYSHMLFEEGRQAGLAGLLSTHPPLAERIRRIDPSWQGGEGKEPKEGMKEEKREAPAPQGGAWAAGAAAFSAGAGLSAIGNPGAAHLAVARQQLESLPARLREEVHTTLGAAAAMYALIIAGGDDPAVAADQRRLLDEDLPADQCQTFLALFPLVAGLPRERYLPLVELAVPALKQLSERQLRDFLQRLNQLILADARVSLLEWSLFRILRYNLAAHGAGHGGRIKLGTARPACEVLLSVLASAGHDDAGQADAAFRAAAVELGMGENLQRRGELAGDVAALERAVDQLKRLEPLQKPRLLKAMVKCIHADGRVTPLEGELLRAVASLLDCPVPPLLPDQQLI